MELVFENTDDENSKVTSDASTSTPDNMPLLWCTKSWICKVFTAALCTAMKLLTVGCESTERIWKRVLCLLKRLSENVFVCVEEDVILFCLHFAVILRVWKPLKMLWRRT